MITAIDVGFAALMHVSLLFSIAAFMRGKADGWWALIFALNIFGVAFFWAKVAGFPL